MSQTSVEQIRQMVSFNSEQFLMKTDDANGVAFVLKRIELGFQWEINNVVIGLNDFA